VPSSKQLKRTIPQRLEKEGIASAPAQGSSTSPRLANRLDSRRSLLRADPGFANNNDQESSLYNQQYNAGWQPQPQPQSQYYGQQQRQQSFQQSFPRYQQNNQYDPPGGYYEREGLAPSSGASYNRRKMGFLETKWSKAFMGTVSVQAVLCLAFEA
jgi:hypothetical protein